jgi:acetyl-CoA carboxylase biotin carboxylase subunit
MGITHGSDVPVFYDSLVGKVIAWGSDREEARLRLLRALDEMVLGGVTNNIPFHTWCLSQRRFITGDFSTRFIEEEWNPDALQEAVDLAPMAIAAALAAEEEMKLPGAKAYRPPAASPWALASRPGRG